MMNSIQRRRITVVGFLALGLGLVLVLASGGYQGRPANAAGSTPDLAMAIDVNGGGDDCDTKASTPSIGATCTVTVGQQFTLKGSIDKVAGLPGTGGYVVFQYRFLYTNPGLTRNNRTSPPEVGSPTYWGIACSPNTEGDAPGNYYVDCWGPGTKSMYTGKLVEVDFTCATAGMRTITMNDADTYVHNDSHGNTPLDTEGDEVLTINCVAASAAVGGFAELPNAAGAALDADAGGSGTAMWLIAVLAAVASAIAVGAGSAGWYARKRWYR
ncbi:MAG: hypothetical protein WBD55_01405 [Dehalococcoidia bacterium]